MTHHDANYVTFSTKIKKNIDILLNSFIFYILVKINLPLWIICVFLCLVFLMLWRLFIAALWSPAGKGLTSWLLLVMFLVFVLLLHVVSWVRCGT